MNKKTLKAARSQTSRKAAVYRRTWSEELRNLSEQAENGDMAAAMKLIALFAALADDPTDAHPELVRHFARAAQSIVNGEKPGKALGLKHKGKGRPKDASVKMKHAKAISTYLRARMAGKGKDEARSIASKAAHVSIPTVSRLIGDKGKRELPDIETRMLGVIGSR